MILVAAASAAFISIFIAELGDKTQLVSLSLACRYPPLQVLAGAMVGLGLVLGLSVGAGGLVAAYVPAEVVTAASGILFVTMGLLTLLRREPTEKSRPGKGGLYQTAVMIFLAELGDKTQMAALLLSAHFAYPVAVFAGAMAAMFFNHALAVFLGWRLISKLPPVLLKKATGYLFIGIGTIMLFLLILGKV